MKNSTLMQRSALYLAMTAAAASTSFTIAQVSAQQADAIQVEAEELFLEELIVTAQKRTESAQDIPVTVSAFSDDQLYNTGITRTEDLGQYVPGLEVVNANGEGSQLLLFLRGAGLNDFNTNNAGPVGLYSDEVYVSSPALSPFQLFDAERVEVIKGPQGTIYGRNTTGGAVKFITKKPTRETRVAGRWRFSNNGKNVVEASASGALSETVSARVAAATSQSDGSGTNLVDGSDVNSVDNSAFRVLVAYEPNENLKVLANVHGAYVDNENTTYSPLGTLDPNTGQSCSNERILANQCVNRLGYRAPDNVRDGNYDGIGKVNLDSFGGYLQVDYQINDDVKFTSVTAYDDVDRFLPEQPDASPQNLLHVTYGVDSQTFSQELRLTGETDRMDWLAGLYYLNEDIKQNQTVDLLRELRPLTGGFADPQGTALGAPIFFARSINEQNLETTAAYAQASYSINDSWSLTLGGRYTDESRSFDAAGFLEEPETFGPAPVSVYDFNDLEVSSSESSFRLGAEYRPNSNTLVYGSVATGFKSGGFNGGFLNLDPRVARRQLDPYAPEFVTAYEFGFKSDLFDSKVRLNAAVFFNDYEDLQVFTIDSNNVIPVLVLDNASNAQTQGIEVDFSAVLTRGLSVNLGASFIDSELQEFTIEQSGRDLSGNRLSQTPETSISGFINYEHDMSFGGYVSAQLAVAYKSDLFFSIINDPIASQDAYTLASTRLAYTNSEETWTAALFVTNLTDEEYLLGVGDFRDVIGSYNRSFGEGRSYGLELSFDF